MAQEDNMIREKEEIEKAWDKAKKDKRVKSAILRKDKFGAWIMRDKYNDKSEYGWVLHEEKIENQGFGEKIIVLPLHWENKIFVDTGNPSNYVTSLHANNIKL